MRGRGETRPDAARWRVRGSTHSISTQISTQIQHPGPLRTHPYISPSDAGGGLLSSGGCSLLSSAGRGFKEPAAAGTVRGTLGMPFAPPLPLPLLLLDVPLLPTRSARCASASAPVSSLKVCRRSLSRPALADVRRSMYAYIASVAALERMQAEDDLGLI